MASDALCLGPQLGDTTNPLKSFTLELLGPASFQKTSGSEHWDILTFDLDEKRGFVLLLSNPPVWRWHQPSEFKGNAYAQKYRNERALPFSSALVNVHDIRQSYI
jgi:hypothetical protein